MKPSRDTNTKARTDLYCPGCGMDLRNSGTGGYVKGNQTYCCEGCAEGTGCTCSAPVPVKKSMNRRGDRGWRNAENSRKDRNLHRTDSSGREVKLTRTGRPRRNLSSVQMEVINPRRAHRTTSTRATSTREAQRRQKHVSRLGSPARRQRRTAAENKNT